MDLVPSLVTTHTVPNPEYDPEVDREQQEEAAMQASRDEEEARATATATTETDTDPELPPYVRENDLENSLASPTTPKEKRMQTSSNDQKPSTAEATEKTGRTEDERTSTGFPSETEKSNPSSEQTTLTKPDNLVKPLPSALPGVSTTLTAADKTVTLDIRWTILCDLFLALVADSVYDSRSRVLLGRIADRLGLTWADVSRFERRLTEALEIQEGIAKRENMDVLELRKQADKKKRYMMMGLATLGGGLVIGLSAGLLAPVIGAGIGAAFATVGVSGTGAFLSGAGGAAVITTGGILTGSSIGGRGMARRTRAVGVFDFMPLHNNKRLSAFITIPGYVPLNAQEYVQI